MSEVRLVDANALKIEIEKQIAYCDDKSKHQSNMEEVLRYSNTSYGLRLAHNYIDNAPTVEGYFTGFGDGCELASAMFERPKGEWIEETSETGALGIKYTWVRCNQCGWSNSLVIPKNFCPNCGADMRGK